MHFDALSGRACLYLESHIELGRLSGKIVTILCAPRWGTVRNEHPLLADGLDRGNRRKDHPVPWESVEFSAHGPFQMRVLLLATHNVMSGLCFSRS
jgi:hypothetical protein